MLDVMQVDRFLDVLHVNRSNMETTRGVMQVQVGCPQVPQHALRRGRTPFWVSLFRVSYPTSTVKEGHASVMELTGGTVHSVYLGEFVEAVF